jgi:hypothetical protein
MGDLAAAISRHRRNMPFRDRLKQEVGSAACKRDAEIVIDAHCDALTALEPCAKERLLTEIADIYAELPDDQHHG